tara:strand:- start:440 stop:649 length:210 start_codon:yes stop_codon:yes gene_type:complete
MNEVKSVNVELFDGQDNGHMVWIDLFDCGSWLFNDPSDADKEFCHESVERQLEEAVEDFYFNFGDSYSG